MKRQTEREIAETTADPLKLAELALSLDSGVRFEVASNPNTPAEVINQLSLDSVESVANAAKKSDLYLGTVTQKKVSQQSIAASDSSQNIWKIFIAIGSITGFVAFLLGLAPIGDGRCGSRLFPVSGSSNNYVGNLNLPCFPPDSTPYWLGIALGVALIVVGLILMPRQNQRTLEVDENGEVQVDLVENSEVTKKSSKISNSEVEVRVKCPYCAEKILSEAIVCKHCGRDV